MSKHKIKKLSLCGGEPFLFPDLIDVVSFAHQNRISCNITSNGMNIFKLRDGDFKILKENKSVVNISIDSFNEEIQSKTRGSELSLNNALRSIKKLQENNIPVIVLSVISKYNYTDLYKSIVLAYEQNIAHVLYQPVIRFSNYPERKAISNKTELNVPAEHFDLLLNELKKISIFERKHKISTNIYRLLPWLEQYIKYEDNPKHKFFFNKVLPVFYCREALAVIDIDYYGGIQPCGLSLAQNSIKANKNTDLLIQWQKEIEDLRRDLSNFDYPGICNGCCHKFSRNMMASAFKRPFTNRLIFIKLCRSIIDRIFFRLLKNNIFGK
jgi:MoaA/NifB/PqqE/SkfB family radical SAM enzyme